MSQRPSDFVEAQAQAETFFLAEADMIDLMLAVRSLEDAQLRLRLAIKRARGEPAWIDNSPTVSTSTSVW